MDPRVAWLPCASEAAPDLLGQAVRAVACLTPAQVLVPDVPGWGEPVRATARTPVRLHPSFRRHQHAVCEVCLALGGTAGMTLHQESYLLPAPCLLVLPPGVAHGEGRAGSQPYDLLWFGFAPDLAITAGISSFRLETGWTLRGRRRLAGPAAARLWRRMHDANERPPLTPGDWPSVQNELLEALVALQREALAPSRAPRVSDARRQVVADVQHYLRSHLAQPLSLPDIAHLVRLSPNYVNTLFRRRTGSTVHAWLTRQRLAAARKLLRGGALPIREVAAAVGFADPLYFSKAYRRAFGHPPSAARRPGR